MDSPTRTSSRASNAPAPGLPSAASARSSTPGGARRCSRSSRARAIALFRGLPSPRGNVEFTQDKTFWYLTGIESPDAALVLDARTGAEILFLPEPRRSWETWNGELWDTGDDWVGELSGFADVRATEDLEDALAEILAEQPPVWISLQPHTALSDSYDSAYGFVNARKRDPFDGRVTREERLEEVLVERYGVEVRDCKDHLNALRAIKQPEEIAAMRRAARAGARAMAEAMRSTRPGMGEWELDALMSLVHVLEGADGPAYAAIVGAGANACVLHYLDSAKVMEAHEGVLIDYGPEVDHYVTDITRSWPVGGRFEGRYRELYEGVLAAQEAGIAAVKPGATLDDVNRACYDLLRERGLVRRPAHGACHSIGMEVHDPGLSRDEPLVPGMVFTIEPGVYELDEGIGIRIEDVVVCTEDGAEVLSADVPRSIEAIEALIAERGILDPPAVDAGGSGGAAAAGD